MSFVMSKELEPTEGWRYHVQHNLNVCCQRLSMKKMMMKKMNSQPVANLQTFGDYMFNREKIKFYFMVLWLSENYDEM